MDDRRSTANRAGQGELIVLTAFLMALVALAIDMVLPALGFIASDFGNTSGNSQQYVVSAVFLGLTLGQLLYGPLSDSVGRKPAIHLGFLVFIVGSIVCFYSASFEVLLIGRVLQGLGAASMRIVVIAMIRDRYAGAAMARIVSMVMSILVIVPCVAPLLGQGLLWLGHWRGIFLALPLIAVVLWVWFWLRLQETLPEVARRPYSPSVVKAGFGEVIRNLAFVRYSISAGLLQGAFLGYLITAQPIMQGLYGVGDSFALYFAIIAISLGVSHFANATMVSRFGMDALIRLALILVLAIAAVLYGLETAYEEKLPFWTFLAAMSSILFCFGFIQGNLNALAMQPMAHIAGMVSSALGVISGAMSLGFGSIIGTANVASLAPLALGFVTASAVALVLIYPERTVVLLRKRPASPEGGSD